MESQEEVERQRAAPQNQAVTGNVPSNEDARLLGESPHLRPEDQHERSHQESSPYKRQKLRSAFGVIESALGALESSVAAVRSAVGALESALDDTD